MRRKVLAIWVLAVTLGCLIGGCVKGSAVHKVTMGQHTLREAVGGFQDAEIAEFQKGFVPKDVHIKMQTVIQKVALAGVDLDNAVANGATAADLKAKFDNIYNLIDSLNTDGILGVKDPTSKQTLEVALDSVKAIVDNILVEVK